MNVRWTDEECPLSLLDCEGMAKTEGGGKRVMDNGRGKCRVAVEIAELYQLNPISPSSKMLPDDFDNINPLSEALTFFFLLPTLLSSTSSSLPLCVFGPALKCDAVSCRKQSSVTVACNSHAVAILAWTLTVVAVTSDGEGDADQVDEKEDRLLWPLVWLHIHNQFKLTWRHHTQIRT
ncbi:hypothetical protein D9C73_010993 [Collichthys lucidus]|uniref:Uncharacterized protein n=1 Tax=Collichthys lucidus TaxID=240159 RepID=A0A4U5UPE7_COLLU|nr:hypothetical protein D9C73_010993 [Collichthys lucidus]